MQIENVCKLTSKDCSSVDTQISLHDLFGTDRLIFICYHDTAAILKSYDQMQCSYIE